MANDKKRIAEKLKKEYLIPALNMLKAEVAKGNLPKTCIMKWSVEKDIEVCDNVKKMKD